MSHRDAVWVELTKTAFYFYEKGYVYSRNAGLVCNLKINAIQCTDRIKEKIMSISKCIKIIKYNIHDKKKFLESFKQKWVSLKWHLLKHYSKHHAQWHSIKGFETVIRPGYPLSLFNHCCNVASTIRQKRIKENASHLARKK